MRDVTSPPGLRGLAASLITARLARHYAVLRRDLRTIAGDLTGRRPPPFAPRAPLPRHLVDAAPAARGSAPRAAARALQVARILRPADGAAVLHLQDPAGDSLDFRPGQLLTLAVTLPSGEVLRRAYPVTGGAGEGEAGGVALAVQRARGGRISRFLCDELREGDVLEAVPGRGGDRAAAPALAEAA